jgi:hypothetical protein
MSITKKIIIIFAFLLALLLGVQKCADDYMDFRRRDRDAGYTL